MVVRTWIALPAGVGNAPRSQYDAPSSAASCLTNLPVLRARGVVLVVAQLDRVNHDGGIHPGIGVVERGRVAGVGLEDGDEPSHPDLRLRCRAHTATPRRRRPTGGLAGVTPRATTPCSAGASRDRPPRRSSGRR